MREIHLRKLSYDEARQKLEREIHSAFYSGEQFLEIVHGVGGGVIRKMVYEYIQTLDFVKPIERSESLWKNPGTLQVELLVPGLGARQK